MRSLIIYNSNVYNENMNVLFNYFEKFVPCERTFERFNHYELSSGNLKYLDRVWINKPKKYIHSRLHFLQDKAGKTRNIAIVDEISQQSLLNLHNSIFKILRRVKSDATFDVQKAWTRIQKGLSLGETVYSVDMSSCTERFPVIIQSIVLNYCGLLNEESAKA
jgi:hypothetical protein